MSFLRRLEHSLDDRLRALFGASAQPGAREAIELYRDALEQISRRAAVGTQGSRIFPFTQITIELLAPEDARRAVLEAIFEPAQMLDDVRDNLSGERVSVPDDLSVAVRFVEAAAVEMKVTCTRAGQPSVAPVAKEAPPYAPCYLTVVNGAGAANSFTATGFTVNLGRVAEVTDTMGRSLRQNHLFFPDDADEANSGVSREHAHLVFDRDAGNWRLYDDGSSLGTAISRAGRRVEVPAQSSRGVALEDGDEIYLGPVRVLFSV